ncbi:hypothetical protein Tco_0391580, partial [Tanacetum coccineum]
LALAIVAACASRAAIMPSAISCWMAVKIMDGDSTEILVFMTSRDKYGDNGMSDPIGGLVFKGLRKSNGKRIIVISDKDMSHHTTGYK